MRVEPGKTVTGESFAKSTMKNHLKSAKSALKKWNTRVEAV